MTNIGKKNNDSEWLSVVLCGYGYVVMVVVVMDVVVVVMWLWLPVVMWVGSKKKEIKNQSPMHRPLSAHHCVLVGQGPLPQRTIYFNQPLSVYVDNDKIGRKPAIVDDIYHYPE